MSVYVCLKQVPNLEGVPSIQPEAGFVQADAWFMNPLDGYALREALQAAKTLGCACVAVSAGGPESTAPGGDNVLRLALALGAERAVQVSPLPALAGPALTAANLAAAIRADSVDNADKDAPSLVFCGRQASDLAGMQVPYRLAALLGCGVVSDVSAWSLRDGTILAECQAGNRRWTMEADLPCVLALNRGTGDVPRPTLPGMLHAKKKSVRLLAPEAGPEAGAETDPVLMRTRNPRGARQLRMAEGATIEEKVQHLVEMLHRDGCSL